MKLAFWKTHKPPVPNPKQLEIERLRAELKLSVENVQRETRHLEIMAEAIALRNELK